MTASVTRVLVTPRNAPATTIPAVTTVSLPAPRAITARSSEKSARTAVSVGSVPKRRCSTGASHTEAMASSRPQPKKVQPMPMIE